MKVIDLLNKIANGEELPKKLKIDDWEYDEESEDLETELLDRLHWEDFSLNDEVEIIEEHKTPEKWGDLAFTTMRKREDSIDDDIEKIKGYIETIMETQNEILDYLEEIE